MNIVRCNMGHFFDADRDEGCPLCAPRKAEPEIIEAVPAALPEAESGALAGWLVCTAGADAGRDYRLYGGYNYIGFTPELQVSRDLPQLRDRAGVIGYDDAAKTFSAGPCSGSRIVRVNGKMVLNDAELKAYDEVSVGDVKFLFVPLCGEQFSW